jgi:hypothetical protein
LFIFPFIYVASFLYFFKGLSQGKPERIVWFVILGMSIYTTSLSLTYQYGLLPVVNVIKYFKEIAAVSTLGYLIANYKGKIQFHLIDWLVFILFVYCFTYVFLPIGKMTIVEKITVFKSYGMFGLLYFIGRLLPLTTFPINKIVTLIIATTLLAVGLQQVEVLFNQHFQTITSYSDYNQKVNLLYPSGSYGLTMTFETDNSIKRFASFFQDPLDFAVSLLMCLCIVLAWISFDETHTIKTKWKWLIVVLLLWALYKTFSRASMLGAVIVMYAYAILTKRKLLLKILYFSIFLAIVLFMLFASLSFKAYVFDTITLRESSSLGHLISWVAGLDAMIIQPFGLGLGSSGLYAFGDGLGIGGENQAIFMGVQTGVVSMVLYLAIYIAILVVAAKNWKKCLGPYKQLAFSILLIKIGSFVPMLTSYFESFLYMSYITWLLTGVLINNIVCQPLQK